MVSTTGARLQKGAHPKLPLTTEAILDETLKCWDAGVRALHLHVREADGTHTIDPKKVRDTTAALRSELGNDIVIQMTTEAAGKFSADEQMATVREARPEAISIAVREVLRARPEDYRSFFSWLKGEGIATQFLLYDLVDFRTLLDLIQNGAIGTTRPNVLFGIGSYAPPRLGRTEDLAPIHDALSRAKSEGIHADWMVCCFGKNEASVTKSAAEAGGHMRVGFENNSARPDGSPATDNAELVRVAVEAIETIGRKKAPAQEIRDRWAWL